MSEKPALAELYEFGPFRLDVDRQILFKDGFPVSLTPDTFQIILVLARHGREVVSTHDLIETVWPDSFVDETSLSRNLLLLRNALGETLKGRRYIITVPGRGYRLAEHVRSSADPEPKQFNRASFTRPRIRIKIVDDPSRSWLMWLAAGLAFVAVVWVVALWRTKRHAGPLLSATDTVVVAGFANATGDPIFDDTLRQGLIIQLRQSPYLSLVSDQRMAHVLRIMGQSPGTPVTLQIARDLCDRIGSTVTLEGSIAARGSHYLLNLEARRCRSGEVFAQQQIQIARKEDSLPALGDMASRFLKAVGEPSASMVKAAMPSLEALHAYSVGWKLYTGAGPAAASPWLQQSVVIDPKFALAQATLARVYADLDQPDLAALSATRAWQARGPASDREEFLVAATYEELATGDLTAARQNDETWARQYPRDPVPWTLLSGDANRATGRYRQAITSADQAIALDPDCAIAWYNLAVNHVSLGELDEAQSILRRAYGRSLLIDEFLLLQHDIAFLRADHDGMEQTATLARERSGADAWVINQDALAAAYYGHLQNAKLLTDRAMDQAIQEKQPERAALWQTEEILREAFFGKGEAAQAKTALTPARNREEQFGAAFAAALAGNNTQAQTQADDLEHRFPEDTIVRFSYVPVIRARIALNQRNPTKALQLLERARPYESGAFFGATYAIYERGEAWLAARRGREAAAEFQWVLDRRGIVGSDPIGALAHLQLGRARALVNDRAGAKAAYQDFLFLWSDADPDIPVFMKAKADYAALP